MWITQTYLGAVEPDAKAFVYYMYEDYVSSQQKFTRSLQRRLEKLGEAYGSDLCLMMPNPRYAGRVEAEVRENRALWQAIHAKLPALLLATEPLTQITSYDSRCRLVALGDDLDEAVMTIKRFADEAITWNYRVEHQTPDRTWRDRFFDALEVKIGVPFLKLDAKKFLG